MSFVNVRKISSNLILYLFFPLAIALISSIFDYASAIIAATTLIAIFFIYAEYRKERMILTVGSGFTIYWYLYTTSYWLNYKLGYHQNEDMNYIYILTILSIIGFLSFQMVYYPGKSSILNKEGLNYRYYNKRLLKIGLSLIFIIALLMELRFFYKIGFTNFVFISRSQRSLLIGAAGLTFFSELFFMVMILSYILNQVNTSRILRFLFFASAVNNIVYQLIIIDRSGLLKIFFPCIFLFLAFKKVKNWHVILLGISMFVLLSYFKIIMSNVIFGGSSELGSFRFNSEFEAWYNVGVNVLSGLESDSLTYIHGDSYITALYNLVVPFNNSEPLSVWYVRTYFYKTYLKGGGAGFSSIAEAVLNFGYIGVPCYFMLLGFLCRWTKKYKHKDIKYLAIYTFIFTVLYKFFRAEFFSLTKTSWWFYILPVIILFYFANMVKDRRDIFNKNRIKS